MSIDLLACAYVIQRLANTTLDYCEDDIHLASPKVTESRGCGDCEDLALWRYVKMKEACDSENQMQISAFIDEGHVALEFCDSWQRCYRMEHGRNDIFRIDGLSNVFFNPDDKQLYERIYQ